MKTPAHILGFSPDGMGDMWLACVLKETTLSTLRGHHMPWTSVLSEEPGGGQGWLMVTQWPADSQAGPEPRPRLHLLSRPRSAVVGRRVS